MVEASSSMQNYFERLNKEVSRIYEYAQKARSLGYDPEKRVDIAIAKNMSERVEGLISSVAPQLLNSGVTKRILELEKKFGVLDWRVALSIAEEVAKEKFCKFKDLKEAMEVGIRTGFAYITLGVVSAPLEGFVELNIKKRQDGKDYVAIKFASPIRGAGGTAAAVCVIIADYIRKVFGFEAYDPTEKEINRFATELFDYDERVTNLQYRPTKEEILFLAANIPVEIDGDPTEKLEVSNYKDLERVSTNRIRGGFCLVVSMIALKAPKLWKELKVWGKDFNIDWSFLEEFLKIQKLKKAATEDKELLNAKISPDYTFITDLVGGRPVLSFPMASGGFRLRLGRSRTSGFSAVSLNPTTMELLENYIAIGTQLKLERPGKAAAISSCDSIEGPVVRLKDGTLLKLDSVSDAKRVKQDIEKIIYLGDILISYGDFLDRAHKLVPLGYCEEWYIQELEASVVEHFGSLDFEKTAYIIEADSELITNLFKNPFKTRISSELAFKISNAFNVPLHPYYTYYWTQISKEDFIVLLKMFEKAKIEDSKIIFPLESKLKSVLEILGIPHRSVQNEFIVVERNEGFALIKTLGLNEKEFLQQTRDYVSSISKNPDFEILSFLTEKSGVQIKDKAGTFIGARMGRPEKAKMRVLIGSPNVLFPVGEQGGKMRSFQAALEAGFVEAEFPLFFCSSCNKKTIYPVCEVCNKKTTTMFYCSICGELKHPCKHTTVKTYRKEKLDINHYFKKALERLETDIYPDLIKGVRGTNNKDHVLENLCKGILRAKYGLCVNKDGTVRYDMTELPITHFKPSEIGTSVEKLKELGYEEDIYGRKLVSEEQIIELKPQDIIIPKERYTDEPADIIMFKVSKLIDELLEKFYKLKPFYNLKSPEELVGQLVIGLAPHTSAGIVCRIIGFSKIQAILAHPLCHAAMRRDCDGDETSIILLMDGFINFSRQYLPDKRGGRTMDSPLVLTETIVPSEVDDMVYKMDVTSNYPLELYNAAQNYKMPNEVNVETLGKRLGTYKQYEGFLFTHPTSNINLGTLCSSYKTLPTMEEKIKGQMKIAELLRAVDSAKVAELVIEKHLLKDLRGNLRKFSRQQFRCVKCNKKYRRMPFAGKCDCGGRIIFTISEGSIIKYLEPALSIAEKYNVSTYLKQSLELTKNMIESVFGKEKEKQQNLKRWFG
ncbi:MAG: DNA polymerase II large subunit [Candidatus Woesearchaeota archaeon]